jgi:hypothetical protein
MLRLNLRVFLRTIGAFVNQSSVMYKAPIDSKCLNSVNKLNFLCGWKDDTSLVSPASETAFSEILSATVHRMCSLVAGTH